MARIPPGSPVEPNPLPPGSSGRSASAATSCWPTSPAWAPAGSARRYSCWWRPTGPGTAGRRHPDLATPTAAARRGRGGGIHPARGPARVHAALRIPARARAVGAAQQGQRRQSRDRRDRGQDPRQAPRTVAGRGIERLAVARRDAGAAARGPAAGHTGSRSCCARSCSRSRSGTRRSEGWRPPSWPIGRWSSRGPTPRSTRPLRSRRPSALNARVTSIRGRATTVRGSDYRDPAQEEEW